MPQYLDSTNVKMFPSAYRGKDDSEDFYDPDSYFTTEGSLTKLATLGFYNKSFIEQDGDNLTIVINGYRFEVTITNVKALFNDLSSVDSIYANINVVDKGVNDSFPTLVSFESSSTIIDNDNEKFIALAFDTTTTGMGSNPLKVLEKVDGVWRVPSASKLNIVASQIMTDNVDDKNKSIVEKFEGKNINLSGEIRSSDVITKNLVSPTQYGNYGTITADYDEGHATCDISNFTLVDGCHIFITMTGNQGLGYSIYYLNVTSTGYKPIGYFMDDSGTFNSYPYFYGGQVYELVYNENAGSDGAWIVVAPYTVENVGKRINGQSITTIFENNGTTVKNATNSTNATNSSKIAIASSGSSNVNYYVPLFAVNTSSNSYKDLKYDTHIVYNPNTTYLNMSSCKVNVNKLNTNYLNDVAIDDIFENDNTIVKNATNVTSKINGQLISTIFENNGTTVKNATHASLASSANSASNTSFTNSSWNSIELTANDFVNVSKYEKVILGTNTINLKSNAYEFMIYYTDSPTSTGAYARRYYNFPIFKFPINLQTNNTYKATIGTCKEYYGLDYASDSITFTLDVSILVGEQSSYNETTLQLWNDSLIFKDTDTIIIYYRVIS